MAGFVGRQHEFHSSEYAQQWSDQFESSAPRLKLFDSIINHIKQSGQSDKHIVELGIGPGYLAKRLLGCLKELTYEGIDDSEPMLEIANRNLSEYSNRLYLTKADLLSSWVDQLKFQPHTIVTTWALHDLGGEEQTAKVYRDCKAILPKNGIFINGDFIKPDRIAFDFEPGRFEINRHVDLLSAAGFSRITHSEVHEHEMSNPTSAHNYVCLTAVA